MGLNEINQLQAEWRAIVLDKLTSVEQTQKEVKADIVEIKTSFATQTALQKLSESNKAEIEKLNDKVDKMQTFKYKFVAVCLAVQLVVGCAIWWFEHFHPIK
jgi:hypothetical protein